MVSRASSRRWLLRDLPRAYVVLVCAAFVAGGFIYFIDWSQVRRETAGSNSNNSGNGNNGSAEQRYSGSLILPERGDRCWEGMFDNRTGRMIDKGYVKCDEAAQQLAERNKSVGIDTLRLREVGKVFRHENR